ncbi:uncharacterized protein BYT42DRAFT_569908 [Radiomyces spectabilis]|uniref:uncharacterized protein n=1 Tax=Radiomyces spectabilis TaxID=64574 RepID=UPI00221E78E9|nr:uncharacterized protein BYT42DRAFT_569908 [Radiomyces spectabilis]KAI8379752.1 hypothetical protein BYT42DRAFT_569908 [Radiomyces spectabilis]
MPETLPLLSLIDVQGWPKANIESFAEELLRLYDHRAATIKTEVFIPQKPIIRKDDTCTLPSSVYEPLSNEKSQDRKPSCRLPDDPLSRFLNSAINDPCFVMDYNPNDDVRTTKFTTQSCISSPTVKDSESLGETLNSGHRQQRNILRKSSAFFRQRVTRLKLKSSLTILEDAPHTMDESTGPTHYRNSMPASKVYSVNHSSAQWPHHGRRSSVPVVHKKNKKRRSFLNHFLSK